MADQGRNVLLLAGRLGTHDHGWMIAPFLDRLAKLGVSAQVLCLSGDPSAGTDYRVVECPALGRWWQHAFAVRRLRPGDGLRRPDLIHVLQTRMGSMGLSLAERWRVLYVQTVDDFLAPDDRLRVSRRWCRGLIAASRDLADDLVRNLGVPKGFLAVVRPGIEIPETASGPAQPRGVPVIGTAGPLIESSGFASFLNAARRVLDGGVDAEFVIAGEGEDEVDLRRRAERLRIADRVTFAGTPVVGLRFWNVLDVFCQTAVVPTLGRTLATALSFGVPSIASDIEGLRSLVTHDVTGLRVPPENSGALAEAILTLLNDHERARRLGQQGREAIRRDFDPDAEAESLVAVYHRVWNQSAESVAQPVLVRCTAGPGSPR